MHPDRCEVPSTVKRYEAALAASSGTMNAATSELGRYTAASTASAAGSVRSGAQGQRDESAESQVEVEVNADEGAVISSSWDASSVRVSILALVTLCLLLTAWWRRKQLCPTADADTDYARVELEDVAAARKAAVVDVDADVNVDGIEPGDAGSTIGPEPGTPTLAK